jgi:hypothetical protein
MEEGGKELKLGIWVHQSIPDSDSFQIELRFGQQIMPNGWDKLTLILFKTTCV